MRKKNKARKYLIFKIKKYNLSPASTRNALLYALKVQNFQIYFPADMKL